MCSDWVGEVTDVEVGEVREDGAGDRAGGDVTSDLGAGSGLVSSVEQLLSDGKLSGSRFTIFGDT